jgi:hypothetical protein
MFYELSVYVCCRFWRSVRKSMDFLSAKAGAQSRLPLWNYELPTCPGDALAADGDTSEGEEDDVDVDGLDDEIEEASWKRTPLEYAEDVHGTGTGTAPPVVVVPGLLKQCPAKFEGECERRARIMHQKTCCAILES